MTEGDGAIARIEVGLRRIARRAFAIEKRLARSENQGKDAWDKAGMFMPLVQAVLLAFVAWWLTDSVNQALRERELELSNVQEMRETLLKLYSNVDSTETVASALTLTAFGRYSVAPLIFALEGGANQNVAAERSLRALGTARPSLVCEPVARILKNRSQGYSVEALLSGVRLARNLECREAIPALDGLSALLKDGEALRVLKGIVAKPSPTEQNLNDLREEVEIARRDLHAAGVAP